MRSPTRDDTLDDQRATTRARLSLSAVDAVAMLKFARSPVRVDVVLNRRAACGDRFAEHAAHRAPQASDGRVAQLAGGRKGVDACTIEDLVRVDVPQSGEHVLIQQQGLDLASPAKKPREVAS